MPKNKIRSSRKQTSFPSLSSKNALGVDLNTSSLASKTNGSFFSQVPGSGLPTDYRSSLSFISANNSIPNVEAKLGRDLSSPRTAAKSKVTQTQRRGKSGSGLTPAALTPSFAGGAPAPTSFDPQYTTVTLPALDALMRPRLPLIFSDQPHITDSLTRFAPSFTAGAQNEPQFLSGSFVATPPIAISARRSKHPSSNLTVNEILHPERTLFSGKFPSGKHVVGAIPVSMHPKLHYNVAYERALRGDDGDIDIFPQYGITLNSLNPVTALESALLYSMSEGIIRLEDATGDHKKAAQDLRELRDLGAAGATARSMSGNAIPGVAASTGAAVLGAGTERLAAMVAPEVPYAPLFGRIIGNVAGGIVGAKTANEAIDWFDKRTLSPEAYEELKNNRSFDSQHYPGAVFIGEQYPNLLTGTPNLDYSRNALIGRAVSGVTGAVTDAGSQYVTTGKVDKAHVAASGIANFVMAGKNTAYADQLEKVGVKGATQLMRGARQGTGVAIRGAQIASRKVAGSPIIPSSVAVKLNENPAYRSFQQDGAIPAGIFFMNALDNPVDLPEPASHIGTARFAPKAMPQSNNPREDLHKGARYLRTQASEAEVTATKAGATADRLRRKNLPDNTLAARRAKQAGVKFQQSKADASARKASVLRQNAEKLERARQQIPRASETRPRPTGAWTIPPLKRQPLDAYDFSFTSNADVTWEQSLYARIPRPPEPPASSLIAKNRQKTLRGLLPEHDPYYAALDPFGLGIR